MKEKNQIIKKIILKEMDLQLVSQADLERHFQLTGGAISKWFSKSIPKARLKELCEILSINFNELLKIANENKGSPSEVVAETIAEYKTKNTSEEPDMFLIECTRLVIGLSQGKNISDDEQNRKIIQIYKEGFSTKSINPKLITNLLNMVN